jgi:hypothetical protein
MAFGVFVGRSLSLPQLDIAFQVPIDVELGMTEEVAAAPIPEPVIEEAPKAPAPKKPRPLPASDAGVADAGPLTDAEAEGGAEAGGSRSAARVRGALTDVLRFVLSGALFVDLERGC